MDRHDLTARYDEMDRQADRQYNRLFVTGRKIQQMPSFGAIPQEKNERFITGDKHVNGKFHAAYTAQEQFGSVPKQRSYSNYQSSSNNTLAQQIAELKMMGEMELARRQQLETLESLKSEIKEMKQFSGLNDMAMDRLSSIDSSSYQDSNTRSDDKPTTKEVLLSGQKKNLQVELSSKMREIQRMLMKERELQNTIHNLRMELDCRVDEKSLDEANRQVHKLEFTVDKLRTEVKQMSAERQKLGSENITLKKQLLRKEFESKLFLEQNSRSNDQQLSELNRRCEQLNDVVNRLRDDIMRTVEDTEKKLLDQKNQHEDTLKEQMQQFQSKQKAFSQQFKDQLVKMDRLKSKIIKQLKDNSASFDYFDTQVQYQTIYGGLIAKLEHLYAGKVDLSNGYSSYTGTRKQSEMVSVQRNTLLDELKQRNHELTQEIRRLNNFIEEENQAKRRFLDEIEQSKSTHQGILQERDALRRESTDLRIINRQYLKVAQTNSFLQGQIRRLNEKNEHLMKEQKAKSEHMYNKSNIDEHEYIKLKQRYEQLVISKGNLQEQLIKLQYDIGKGKAIIQSLEDENNTLNKKIHENSDYIIQIEEALMLVQPKLPGILKKKELISDQLISLQSQNNTLKARIAELEQIVEQIQATYIQPSQQSELQQTIKHLRGDVQRLQEEYKLLKAENSDIHRSREIISSQYQKEVSNLFASHADNERIIQTQFEEELRYAREEIRKLEAERLESLEIIKDINKQNNRKDHEMKLREAQYNAKQLNFQKDITQLTSENAIFKKNYDMQIERLSCSNSETSRILTQKYERDIQQLQLTIQGLQSESKQVYLLQQQLNQLTLINRQLSTQIKERSMAVDHLWEIKQVEFSNIMIQLNTLRNMARQ